MAPLVIEGGVPLGGTVRVSGAKNAALPILAAALLASESSVIEEVPRLKDVETMVEVLEALGARVAWDGDQVRVDARGPLSPEAPPALVGRMRASVLVMGPLLARLGEVRITLPGGCAIGSRPIDQHLKGLEALGAEVTVEHGFITARAKALVGTTIYLDLPSVGATENIMMASVLARGETVIENAAEEPEIVDLANFLNAMGARIRGAGTGTIRIEGVRELKGTRHTVIPDRIEAGTFMVALAATGGEGWIEGAITEHLVPVIAKLREMGVYVAEEEDGLHVVGNRLLKPVDVKTLPYPGFPTDMQPQFMALLSTVAGTSVVTETIFENRFRHVEELRRMGANIRIEGRTAVIEGGALTGATVRATDLRAGAALVIAGLAAGGTTVVENVYHLDRGYERLEAKLQGLGARIRRVDEAVPEPAAELHLARYSVLEGSDGASEAKETPADA
ncbi:MAG: UDP-N-acetylglucosamine 1-carboxyvinyltransferase [Hydrogenibacillus schlegelii]|uniref:UDP-N-acetylglucosamine 1-carboxyvinyltransferase n=1 Tax=Hydrogenibacillus schlegelii TaxID=1484 RepID=A0A2T5GEH5_HYDSH|nr:UDP-N-acetylglucosamine 1-carboxyvinyltransferase [Hydrogenibacillus schlegelii]PTQ54580.1 MAG: UDP-N-acetylglucosamine 1-carboxyvinyltransferase [Hydrogenibacillus schlegelii]